MADRKATAFTEAVSLVTDFIPFVRSGDTDNFRDAIGDILDLYNARIATVINKTFDLTDNTLDGTKAEFDIACSNDDFAYIGQTNIFTQNQEIEKTGAIPILTFDRPEVLVDNTTITRINFSGFDDASATEIYAQIRVVVASDAAANPDGCLDLRVDEAGTLTNYITLNDLGGGDIDLRRPVNFNSQNVSNMGILQFVDANQTIQNNAGNLFYDVATGQVHLWRINNVTEMQLSATALSMQGNSILLGGSNVDNIRNLIHDQSVSGTDINFSEDEVQTISISANTTFTTANRATGKSKTLKIVTDATLRTLTFPAWKFIGTKPADQAASKTGVLTVTCFGTADTDIVAAYAVEA